MRWLDKDALYNHYLVCGRNEQRQPYETGTEQSVPAFVPMENKTSGTTAAEAVIYMGSQANLQFPTLYMLTGSRPVRQRYQQSGGYTWEADIKYDAQGIPDSIFSYDAEGRLYKVGGYEGFEFDEDGKLIKWDNIYTLYYDKQGFLTKVTSQSSFKDEFGYNEQGKIAWVSNSYKNELYGKYEYTYNEQGQLINLDYHNYERNEIIGCLLNYDEQGRLINLVRTKNGIPSGTIVTYIYE